MKSIIFFIFLSFLLYARSLNYSFHYDDYTKLVLNPAEKSVSVAATAFTNREVQSINPELNTNMYRPLFVMDLALDYQLFKNHPAGYRFINILLHGLNAGIVCTLAAELLGLGITGAVISGLVFLLHPAQLESTIWIVERSNLMAGLMMLAAIFFWKKGSTGKAMVAFVIGLLFKESMTAFPFVAFLITPRDKKKLGSLFLITIIYMLVRHSVLGRTSNIAANFFDWKPIAGQIIVGAGMAAKYLIFPLNNSINHPPWNPPANPLILISTLIAFAGLFVGMFWSSIHRQSKMAFCCALMLAFWLPTSQIIPIKSVFSERFLYPVLIGFSFLIGLLFEHARLRVRPFIWLYVGALAVLSWRAIPIWQNDETLWDNAARQYPTYWKTWVFKAEWEKASAPVAQELHQPDPIGWRERAEENYIRALKCGLPSKEGSQIFLRLAELNFQQGKRDQAEINGQRAMELNPNSKNDFELIRRKYVDGLTS